ncbi:MAG: hypothetical protein AAB919_01700 [Patescibacteria group bacterium]
MTTISIPITPEQEKFIRSYIKEGKAENKAQVVRRALSHFAEEEAVRAVLEAEREIVDGKGLRGDLRKLIRKHA